MNAVVSIVIPTLDRAHLLRSALESVLAQTYRQIEVVVADDLSEDDTRAVVDSHSDPRIKYATPSERLNMPDNFEFGLTCATGDYVTFLTDDSYMLPSCIEIAMTHMHAENVDLVVWKHAGYFDHDWLERHRRNTLYVPQTRGDVRRIGSRESLDRWFSRLREVSGEMPRSINSLCSRSVIEAIRARQGRLFLPPAPDHSSGVAMLLGTEAYALIDLPLVVDGVAKESIGPSQSFNLGKSADDFYASFGTADMTKVTFMGLRLTPAIVARSFENACAGSVGACPELDRAHLLSELVDSLAKLEAYGREMDKTYSAIERFALDQGLSGRYELALRRWVARWRWRAVRFARALPIANYLERMRGLDVLGGSEHGFTDVAGAAGALRRHLDRPKRR